MITQNALPLPSTFFVNMENKDVCSKPKRARSQNFSVMEVCVIHNEGKQNPFSKQSLQIIWQNKKKEAVWKSIKESQCSGDCPKISDRGQGQMAEYVRDAKKQFAEHRRETQKTGGGHHLLHSLRQWQTLLICTRAAAPFWDLWRYGDIHIKANRCVILQLKYYGEHWYQLLPPSPPNPAHHFNSLIFQ